MHCTKCQYDLSGLPARHGLIACPECAHESPAVPAPAQPRLLDWLTITLGLAPVLIVITIAALNADNGKPLILLYGLPIATLIGCFLGAIERMASGCNPERSRLAVGFLTVVPLFFIDALASVVGAAIVMHDYASAC